MNVQLDLPLVYPVNCERCNASTTDPVVAVRHFGRNTVQMHFCGEYCANEYYLDQLRRCER